jgi:hypothetical protein
VLPALARAGDRLRAAAERPLPFPAARAPIPDAGLVALGAGVALGPLAGVLDPQGPVVTLLAPFAAAWLGAAVGARLRWRRWRHSARPAARAAATRVLAALLAVSAAAWVLGRALPALRLTPAAALLLGAVAAAASPAAALRHAHSADTPAPGTRRAARAARLDGLLAIALVTAALAWRHPAGVLPFLAVAVGGGALVALSALAFERGLELSPALALLAAVALGAGLGIATDVSPLVVGVAAGAWSAAAAPRAGRRRAVLDAHVATASLLVWLLAGAALTLPTPWVLAAVLPGVVRVAPAVVAIPGARFAAAPPGALALALGAAAAALVPGPAFFPTALLVVAGARLVAPIALRLVRTRLTASRPAPEVSA